MANRPALARSQSSNLELCKLCNNLDPRSHPATYHDEEGTTRSIARLSLQIDPVRLKRSEQNCPRCRLLAETLDAHLKSWRKTKPRLLLVLVECAPLRLEVQDERGSRENIEIYAPPDKPLPWPTLGHAQSVPKYSDSDDSFGFAVRAIDDCIKNHQHRLCGQSRRDEFVPTRLIYVGKSPDSTQHIKLCQLPANKVKYITLSHCWGNGPTFTTTSANMDQRKRHIDFSSMPQSFQDAVVIAQELGIHYIWIDALCIIQDSKEDWELESAKMSSIYENAYLTVAATAAPNSDAGIFSARPRPIKLKYRSSPRSKEYKLCTRKIPEHHPSPSWPPTKKATAAHEPPTPPAGPLRHRAWALQEHVLCSRILHYTAHELLFECRLSSRCECRPSGGGLPLHHHHHHHHQRQSTTTTTTAPRLLPQLLITGRRAAYCRTWHAVVRQYTARALTVPADKLPAVSGIARALLTLRGSGADAGGARAYAAGLWRGNLVGDLLWTRTGGRGGGGRMTSRELGTALETWRAPSWSWASVEGEVSYEGAGQASTVSAAGGGGDGGEGGGEEEAEEGDEEEEGEARMALVEVVDLVARPSGRNPLGAVAEAWVALRGPVLDDVVLVAEADGRERDGQAAGLKYYLKRAGRADRIDVVPDSLLVAHASVSANAAVAAAAATAGEAASPGAATARRARPEETACETFTAPVLCLGLARYESSWTAGLVLGVAEERNGKNGHERLGAFGCGDEWFAGAARRLVVLL